MSSLHSSRSGAGWLTDSDGGPMTSQRSGGLGRLPPRPVRASSSAGYFRLSKNFQILALAVPETV
jgi:hypothetical protein